MKDKEQTKILVIYALLAASLLAGLVPAYIAAGIAFVLFTAAFIGAYAVRGKAGQDSLAADHMTFIIRSLWIAGLFTLVTLTVATVYILNVYDPSPILACADSIAGMTDMAAIEAAIRPCMDEFVSVNMRAFMTGTMIAGVPLALYLALRIARGLPRAAKGHRVGNLQSWF